MRYSPEHKKQTFDRVIHEAMIAIRRDGPDIGIPKLMSKVGLTHGGFYAHFKSKEDLVCVAIESMFNDRVNMMQDFLKTENALEGLEKYIDTYLSELHRVHPEKGCPAAALITEVSRMSTNTKVIFEQGMKSLIAALSNAIKMTLQSTDKDIDTDQIAMILFTQMIGSMTFARSVNNQEYASKILESACTNSKKMIRNLI